jgi:hypothetical protein
MTAGTAADMTAVTPYRMGPPPSVGGLSSTSVVLPTSRTTLSADLLRQGLSPVRPRSPTTPNVLRPLRCDSAWDEDAFGKLAAAVDVAALDQFTMRHTRLARGGSSTDAKGTTSSRCDGKVLFPAMPREPLAWRMLTHVSLVDLGLDAVPLTLLAAKAMVSLDLSRNRISVLPWRSQLFDSLPRLKRLTLSHNALVRLEQLPSTLTEVCASDNFIDAFGDVSYLSKLASVDLAGNRTASWQVLSNFISDLPALSNLRLSGNPVCETPPLVGADAARCIAALMYVSRHDATIDVRGSNAHRSAEDVLVVNGLRVRLGLGTALQTLADWHDVLEETCSDPSPSTATVMPSYEVGSLASSPSIAATRTLRGSFCVNSALRTSSANGAWMAATVNDVNIIETVTEGRTRTVATQTRALRPRSVTTLSADSSSSAAAEALMMSVGGALRRMSSVTSEMSTTNHWDAAPRLPLMRSTAAAAATSMHDDGLMAASPSQLQWMREHNPTLEAFVAKLQTLAGGSNRAAYLPLATSAVGDLQQAWDVVSLAHRHVSYDAAEVWVGQTCIPADELTPLDRYLGRVLVRVDEAIHADGCTYNVRVKHVTSVRSGIGAFGPPSLFFTVRGLAGAHAPPLSRQWDPAGMQESGTLSSVRFEGLAKSKRTDSEAPATLPACPVHLLESLIRPAGPARFIAGFVCANDDTATQLTNLLREHCTGPPNDLQRRPGIYTAHWPAVRRYALPAAAESPTAALTQWRAMDAQAKAALVLQSRLGRPHVALLPWDLWAGCRLPAAGDLAVPRPRPGAAARKPPMLTPSHWAGLDSDPLSISQRSQSSPTDLDPLSSPCGAVIAAAFVTAASIDAVSGEVIAERNILVVITTWAVLSFPEPQIDPRRAAADGKATDTTFSQLIAHSPNCLGHELAASFTILPVFSVPFRRVTSTATGYDACTVDIEYEHAGGTRSRAAATRARRLRLTASCDAVGKLVGAAVLAGVEGAGVVAPHCEGRLPSFCDLGDGVTVHRAAVTLVHEIDQRCDKVARTVRELRAQEGELNDFVLFGGTVSPARFCVLRPAPTAAEGADPILWATVTVPSITSVELTSTADGGRRPMALIEYEADACRQRLALVFEHWAPIAALCADLEAYASLAAIPVFRLNDATRLVLTGASPASHG